ncbi:hypothetical protein KK083_03570 [Fulvivirgaceae bacterium PWU4]|uniref:Uncharacterized protein n=1 Tax=Chryseosolibacter histidini TaxID=2782349 RepID=A0AAP2DGR7_9BACT|nr:hypothetical protein [Chryseosolibacter histidini]MBT1695940.1 hypothetical protein [Chryseosolibacter histidini]
MITKRIASLSFMFVTILLIGCDDKEVTPVSDLTLIPVRLEEPGYTLELMYNDQRQLTHSKATGKMPDNDNIITVQEMFYDASGKLVKSTKNDEWRTEYYYEGDVLVRMDEFYKGARHLDYRFTYNDQGRILETATWKADGMPYSKTLNTWDARGNLISERYYEFDNVNFLLQYLNEYSGYDDKISVDRLFNLNIIGGHTAGVTRLRHQHNPAKLEVRNADGLVSITEQYTYSYNEMGYPTERTATVTFRDGSSRSYTTRYFYEER